MKTWTLSKDRTDGFLAGCLISVFTGANLQTNLIQITLVYRILNLILHVRVTNPDPHLCRVMWDLFIRFYLCMLWLAIHISFTFWPVPHVLLQGLHRVQADQLTGRTKDCDKNGVPRQKWHNKTSEKVMTKMAELLAANSTFAKHNW